MVHKTIPFLVWGAVMMLAFTWNVPLCHAQESGQALMDDAAKRVQDFKFDDATKKLNKALGLFQAAGDKVGMASCLEKIGELSRTLGNYIVAIQAYKRALNLYSELDQSNSRSRVLSATGDVYEDWGDFPGAVQYYEESLKFSPGLNESIRIKAKLAAVYMLLGNQPNAIDLLKQNFVDAHKNSNLRQLGATLLQQGETYEKSGSGEKARAKYEEVLKLKTEKNMGIEAHIRLGNLCIVSGDIQKAISHYKAAQYAIGLGRAALKNGDYNKALKAFFQVLKSGERLIPPDRTFAARAGIGLVRIAQKRNVEAEKNLTKAVEALEEIRILLPMGKRMYFLSGSTHGFKHMAIYEALMTTLALQGKNEDAFKFAESTRSRILTEGLVSRSNPENQFTEMRQYGDGSADFRAKLQDTGNRSNTPIELAPFSALAAYFKNMTPNDHNAAVYSLLVKATFQDFDKAARMEAMKKGMEYCRNAGFDPKAEESLKRKIGELHQRGLRNHLTAFVTYEEKSENMNENNMPTQMN